MVFYGILDLLAKPVFAFVHLYSMRKVDYTALRLNSGKFTEYGPPESSSAAIEKAGQSAGATNGTGHTTESVAH